MMSLLFALLRPHHWIKNLFVFAPLFFAENIGSRDKFISALAAFGIFSIFASAVYIFNDIADRKQDVLHPLKKHRPIASGKISLVHAWILYSFLMGIGILLTISLLPHVAGIFALYLGLNLLYSLVFKHLAFLDLFSITAFYLLRILGGSVATSTPLSQWIILCTLFLTLFLVIAKRKAETNHENHRPVLESYPTLFLDHLLIITLTLTLITYSLYTVLGSASTQTLYSIFFVMLGLFRYLLMIDRGSIKTEYAERLVIADPIILMSILGWTLYMSVIVYLP